MDMFSIQKETEEDLNVKNVKINVRHVKVILVNVHHVQLDLN